MIKKTITVLVAVFLLSACGQSVKEVSYGPLPKELEGCKIFVLEDGVSRITLARCPKSDTSVTYRQGKINQSTTVISD